MAAACSPAPFHPPTEEGWKCTDLWGPAPVAVQRQGDLSGCRVTSFNVLHVNKHYSFENVFFPCVTSALKHFSE